MAAEPVRPPAGEVRGHAAAPVSPGRPGGRGGGPGSRRRGQYGARGAPCGTARGGAGREGLRRGLSRRVIESQEVLLAPYGDADCKGRNGGGERSSII